MDLGFLVFQNTSEVLQAEKALRKAGWKDIRVMGPPPEVRTGCDLVIEFPLMEELKVLKILEDSGVIPEAVVPVSSPLLKPVDLYAITDFSRGMLTGTTASGITPESSRIFWTFSSAIRGNSTNW